MKYQGYYNIMDLLWWFQICMWFLEYAQNSGYFKTGAGSHLLLALYWDVVLLFYAKNMYIAFKVHILMHSHNPWVASICSNVWAAVLCDFSKHMNNCLSLWFPGQVACPWAAARLFWWISCLWRTRAGLNVGFFCWIEPQMSFRTAPGTSCPSQVG